MNLLEAWQTWEVGTAPYLLEGDEHLRSEKCSVTNSTWESLIRKDNFWAPGDTRFHLSLIPIPFAGDIKRAKVVVLLLNPGLDPGDYFGEFEVQGFKERVIANLRQDFSKTEYPFLYLDPGISWHPGFRWWHEKFRGIIVKLAQDWGANFAEARRQVAKNVACVELVPYHSIKYSLSENIREKLRSVRLARQYVNEVLHPRSENGDLLIVVTRQQKTWKLESAANIVVYEGSETRAAHLTANSRGGSRIIDFLRNPA